MAVIIIESLEKALTNALGKKVEFNKAFESIKSGDVLTTYASTDKLEEAIGFKPSTTIEEEFQRFADWYVGYYKCH